MALGLIFVRNFVNMNTEKNTRWSWMLILLSLIVLSLFVGYWNYQAYTEAKNQLATDIQYELGAAYNEVKDSYIQSDIFSFIQKTYDHDSLDITVVEKKKLVPKTKNEIISFEEKRNDFPERHSRDSALKLYSITYMMDDSLNQKKISGNQLKLVRNKKGNLIWVTNDSIVEKEKFPLPLNKNISEIHFDNLFTSSIDRDKKTYALFDKKLIEKNLPSSYVVITSVDNHPNDFKVAYESNTFGKARWEIAIYAYRAYLLKKILPNILFSIFLLGIVGLAFWTLMQNWIKQQELVKTKSEFINNMTHELKTPLATVGVALEAIADFDPMEDAAKTKEYIDISRNEVNRLSLLVDKVLNMAQFDSESPNLNLDTIDLSTIIEKITRSMKVTLNNKDATLNIDIEDNLLLHGDAVHLSNVLYNMLDNALKYSSYQPTITIQAEKENDLIKLSVEDNGSGISPEHLKYIFDRFYRIPTQDRHNVKGHGLGLSYVKEIVKLHGGSISAKSTLGKGSQFIIKLPAITKPPLFHAQQSIL